MPGLNTRPTPGERPSLGAATKPWPRPPAGGGVGNRPGTGTGGNRPSPQPGDLAGAGNRPGIGGNRPNGGGGGNRPGIGGNRPTTLPGDLGGGGNRPGAGGNRPTTLPGDLGGGGNRPGRPDGGGNRPGIGGNRPTTLPGDLGGVGNRPNRPGIGGNRPGAGNRPGEGNRPDWNGNRPDWGGNRPGWNGDRPGWNGGRPGIGGNRPGYGNGGIWNSGNSINNINTNNNSFTNIGVNTGGWGYGPRPGWGYGGGYGGWGYGGGGWGYPGGGGWCNAWNSGFVNPYYNNWYNGCWTGNWGFGSWWAPLAVGATTWGIASSLSNWGLGYGSLGYAGGSYVNPYYASMPAAVVESVPYDYSQPIVVNSYAAPESTDGAPAQPQAAAPANSLVDDALANFRSGSYVAALAGLDKAVKASPNDSVLHELRALTLFALGRYPEAAATLNSLLATAPGMDWTSLSNLYDSVDTYTAQLRRLEDFCRGHRDDAAAHFVLAYHYLVAGHPEEAADALEVVVAKQPGDLVAKQMLDSIRPPATPAEAVSSPAQPAPAQPAPAGTDATTPTAPETDLVGTWKARSDKDAVELTITADSTFTWKATTAGKPAVELSGTIETASDAIKLESDQAGTMIGNVVSKGPDAFDFSLPGAPADVKPLAFQRQKP